MRMSILAATALTLPLTLAACATSVERGPGYQQELTRLSEDCAARGGILTSTGRITDNPAADNACRITGGASRLH